MIDAPAHTAIPLLDATLDHWAGRLLPDLDVWYWDDSAPGVDLRGCMVLQREEYLAHSTFQDIRHVNAWLHWQMPSDVRRMIIAGPDWILRLDPGERDRLLRKQVGLKRGLVMPLAYLDTIPHQIHPFIAGDVVVLCHAAWNVLSPESRRTMLRHEQRRWDDLTCFPPPADLPPHISAIANTFGTVEGANCFGTTAYCASGEDWMRDHWMFQAPFLDIISQYQYRPSHGTPEAGDIVTFSTEDMIVHAAYCVGQDRFLNKNGQSRFNPVRIIDWTSLSADWDHMPYRLWRQPRPMQG